jgi:tetratricopeptide (TPR) repeat protein
LPLDPERLDLVLAATNLALALEEPADARKNLEPALRSHPERADLLELYAKTQAAGKDPEGAVRSLRRALELAPDRVSSAVLLADLLRDRLSRPTQADTVLDRLVKDNPKSAGALAARANHRTALGKLDLAKVDLKLALALAPKDKAVLSSSAELAWRRGEFSESCDHWLALVRTDPNNVAAYLGLVRADLERGQSKQSIAALRQGLKLLPNQPDLLFHLADLLADEQKLSEAEGLRKHLPSAGAQGRSLYLKGRILQQKKQWEEAARAFTESARCPDLSPIALSMLLRAWARCSAEMDARDEQILALRQAVELDPTPSARLALARVLLANRGGDEALVILRSFTKMAVPPDAVWPVLAQALIEENLTRPAWKRSWAEAERMLDRAGQNRANAGKAALLRANMLVVRDEPEAARKVLLEARRKNPEQVSVWKALIELAERQGDASSAKKLAEEADQRFGKQVDWLLVRAEQLVSRQDAQSSRELKRLEESARTLAPNDRDQLDRRLAELFDQHNNRAAVDRLCLGILKRHPNDLRARVFLLEGKLIAADDPAASRLVSEMTRREGEDGTIWRSAAAAWRLSQVERGQRGRLSEARRLVREVRRRRPGWARGAYLEAKADDLEGKPAQALKNYLQTLQMGDYPPQVVPRTLQLLVAEKRFSEANQVVEMVQWHGKFDPALVRPAAEIALAAGKPERACSLARLAVSIGAQMTRDKKPSPRDLIWFGRILDSAGRETDAEEQLTGAVQLAPGLADSWLALLGYLERHDRAGDAESVLSRMKKELPAEQLPLTLARAYEVLHRPEEAEQTYRSILAKSPYDGDVLVRLLHLYTRSNRNAESERVLYLLLDRRVLVPEEALPALRRRLALALTAPERGTPLVDPALKLLALNRTGESESEADRRVAALVRGSVPAHRAESLKTLDRLPAGLPEETLRLAQLHDANGNWPVAGKHLLALLAGDGSNTAWMVVLIDGLMRNGKKAEAAGWLGRLAKLEPNAERTRQLTERLKRLNAPSRPGPKPTR